MYITSCVLRFPTVIATTTSRVLIHCQPYTLQLAELIYRQEAMLTVVVTVTVCLESLVGTGAGALVTAGAWVTTED